MYYSSLHDLFTTEACERDLMMMYPHWKEHIGLIPKAHAWARDGWITYGRWSSDDFIHHGWHKQYAFSVYNFFKHT